MKKLVTSRQFLYSFFKIAIISALSCISWKHPLLLCSSPTLIEFSFLILLSSLDKSGTESLSACLRPSTITQLSALQQFTIPYHVLPASLLIPHVQETLPLFLRYLTLSLGQSPSMLLSPSLCIFYKSPMRPLSEKRSYMLIGTPPLTQSVFSKNLLDM